MSENKRAKSIYPHLDRFELMKLGRMKFLLGSIMEAKEVSVEGFLSSIAVNYGIRRATGLEYLRDWEDGGYITIQGKSIKFAKKSEE